MVFLLLSIIMIFNTRLLRTLYSRTLHNNATISMLKCLHITFCLPFSLNSAIKKEKQLCCNLYGKAWYFFMKTIRFSIWEDGEYTWPQGYGFVPFLTGYLHEDNKERPCVRRRLLYCITNRGRHCRS